MSTSPPLAETSPQRRELSRGVSESAAYTPSGQRIVVTLERTSTGGTRREVQLKVGAGRAMTGAERAEKKRLRKTLFPKEQATQRSKHAERERKRRAQEKTPERKAARLEREQQQSAAEIDQIDREIVSTGGLRDWVNGGFHPCEDWRIDEAKLNLGLPSECKTVELVHLWREDMVRARLAGESVDRHWRPPWLLKYVRRGQLYVPEIAVPADESEEPTQAQSERMCQDAAVMKSWLGRA